MNIKIKIWDLDTGADWTKEMEVTAETAKEQIGEWAKNNISDLEQYQTADVQG